MTDRRNRTDQRDTHEVVIARDAFENIEAIIQPTRVDGIENLSEHEYVEYQILNNRVVMILRRRVVGMGLTENASAKEMED